MTDRRFIRHQNIDNSGKRMRVECRFCRLKQQYNKYNYVSPCACAADTRFVHRDCLQKWVVTKFQHVFNGDYEGDPLQFNVHCQICEQRMEIEYSLINKCSNYDQFVQNLSQHKLWFLFMVILAVILVCLLIFLIVFSQSGNNSSVISIMIVACVVLLIMDLIGFFWKFALIKSIEIDKIPNNKEPPKIMAYEADINAIDNQLLYSQTRPGPYFGSQKYPKDSYADKSLMLQSKRNSGSQNQDSRVSKTFTDILMKKMYNHDSNLKSNELLVVDHHSRRSQKNSMKQIQYSKAIKQNNKPEMKDQDLQVTIHQRNRPASMHPLGMTFQKSPVQDKGIQMTIHQSMSQPIRSQSRSRKRIFSRGQLEQTPKLYQKHTPQTKPSRIDINQLPESQQLPTNKPSIAQDQEVESERQYNLIRDKPSEPSDITPGQESIPIISKAVPKTNKVQGSKIPGQTSRPPQSARIKLKKKNPIKIKVAY